MKTIKQFLFLFFLVPVLLVSGQEKIKLKDCQLWARENHPLLQQKQLSGDISGLAVENLNKNYLPEFNLNGQASYQSDVTHLGISLPNVTMPSLPKDQYKMYIDVSQNIWDGGMTRILTEQEHRKSESEQQQTEVDLYAVRERVNAFFFSMLKLQQNGKILEAKKQVLLERHKQMESALRNGVVLASDLDQLDAELVRLEQDRLEIVAGQKYCAKALAILTGKTPDVFTELQMPGEQLPATEIIFRPELDLFSKQRLLLETSAEVMKKQRNPKFFGFGQLGYGRPGLNMLADNFDSYYLLGVGLKWNIHDWKKTKRNIQSVQLQKQIIDREQQNFERNIHLALAQYEQEAEKLRKVMEQDVKLIALQENITRSSSSKLDNGVLTVSDYIEDLNAEVLAKIKYETHKVQLQEAIEACRFIKGEK